MRPPSGPQPPVSPAGPRAPGTWGRTPGSGRAGGQRCGRTPALGRAKVAEAWQLVTRQEPPIVPCPGGTQGCPAPSTLGGQQGSAVGPIPGVRSPIPGVRSPAGATGQPLPRHGDTRRLSLGQTGDLYWGTARGTPPSPHGQDPPGQGGTGRNDPAPVTALRDPLRRVTDPRRGLAAAGATAAPPAPQNPARIRGPRTGLRARCSKGRPQGRAAGGQGTATASEGRGLSPLLAVALLVAVLLGRRVVAAAVLQPAGREASARHGRQGGAPRPAPLGRHRRLRPCPGHTGPRTAPPNHVWHRRAVHGTASM